MDLQKGEKPILCEICDKTFSNESYLSDHMVIHRDSNPVNDSYDIRHVSTHSGKQPLQCVKCEIIFLEKNMLMEHLRTYTADK